MGITTNDINGLVNIDRCNWADVPAANNQHMESANKVCIFGDRFYDY
jgi:hypothetical protein